MWSPDVDRVFQKWGKEGTGTEDLAWYPTDFLRDIIPIPCHSHNDYWRRVPLFSALRAGCTRRRSRRLALRLRALRRPQHRLPDAQAHLPIPLCPPTSRATRAPKPLYPFLQWLFPWRLRHRPREIHHAARRRQNLRRPNLARCPRTARAAARTRLALLRGE